MLGTIVKIGIKWKSEEVRWLAISEHLAKTNFASRT